jgi:hypothetical protein
MRESVVQTEAKAKAAGEEIVQIAHKNAEEIKKQVDGYAQGIKSSADQYSDQKRAQSDHDFVQAKQAIDQQIAVLKLREMEVLKIWRKEQEEEFFLRRRYETNQVIRNLEVVVTKRVAEFIAQPQTHEALQAIGPEVVNITRQILNGEQAQDNLSKVQELLPFDAKAAKRVKMFWAKVLVYSIVSLTAVIVLFVYPGYWNNIQSYVSGYFSNRKAEGELYAERLNEDRKRRSAFNPKQSKTYKASYTDNVIYTENFITLYTDDKEFQDKWIREANKFFDKELGLDDKVVVKFMPLEETLVKKLSRLRATITPATKDTVIEKMRGEEKIIDEKMHKVFGNQDNYEKFRTFRKSFYEKFISGASG